MATEDEQLEAALITQVRVELAERDMQQKDLAVAAGIDPVSLNRYLKGKRGVSMAVFYKIAAGLDLTPAELMKRVELRAGQ